MGIKSNFCSNKLLSVRDMVEGKDSEKGGIAGKDKILHRTSHNAESQPTVHIFFTVASP